MSLSQISDTNIAKIVQVYDYKVDSSYIVNLRNYVKILERWNQRISLTTITSTEEVVQIHFGESLFALKLTDLSSGRLADVGSGAGFPALALKLACPDLSMRLYEANQKKCAFLHEVVRELGLFDVEIVSRRSTDRQESVPFAGYVSARALGNYGDFLGWARGALLPGGLAILWLGQDDADKIRTTNGWEWQPAAAIPGTRSRVIQIGKIA